MKMFTLLKTMLLATIFVMGSANVWSATGTLTITRSNFPSGTLAYNATDIWTATTSEGDEISGEGDLYSTATQTTMQTKNSGVSTMYHNVTPMPGPITKITLTCASGTTRTYTAYMNSSTVITSTAGGTSKGTLAPASGTSASLVLDIQDDWRYFWLNLAGGASFLSSIVIEYEIGAATDPVITVNPTSLNFSDIVIGSLTEENEDMIEITGVNLTENISLSVTGTNADFFLVDEAEINNEGDIVIITYAPTTPGTHTATLVIASEGAETKEVSLTGNAIMPTPLATAADNVTHNSFTANWMEVAGATEYELQVYTKAGEELDVILSENFDGFTAGAPNGSAHSSDISGSLDNYTETTGWTGTKIYQAGGSVKIGGSNANLGSITTPAIDLSANSGNFNLSFDAMAWNNDQTSLKIYLDDDLVYTAEDLNNNSSYIFKSYSTQLTGGTANSKIKFEGNSPTQSSRFFLDNLVISTGEGIISSPIQGSPFTVTENSTVITGLTPETEYFYTVTAKNGNYTSEISNEITVTTEADPGSGTGINVIENMNLYTANGQIHFTAAAGENVEIYNSVGQSIYKGVAVEGLNSIAVNSGVVLVKIGNEINKVVVK